MRQANLFDYEEPKEEKVYTVANINSIIAKAIKGVPELRSCWVSGEITGYKQNAAGWFFFSLKDEKDGLLAANIWPDRMNAEMLKLLVNGNKVEAHGFISYYDSKGYPQLKIDRMRPRGLGKFYEELERLKRKLYDEGL